MIAGLLNLHIYFFSTKFEIEVNFSGSDFADNKRITVSDLNSLTKVTPIISNCLCVQVAL